MHRQESKLSLHSTMFLLIQARGQTLQMLLSDFTFHDVSINTLMRGESEHYRNPLHSTMFLLILPDCLRKCTKNTFTFHDVSINTSWQCNWVDFHQTLHSTMFLLIQAAAQSEQNINNTALHSTMFLLIRTVTSYLLTAIFFTFHDVSINTAKKARQRMLMYFFTFHDVSINTGIAPDPGHNSEHLYIPRCFY